MSQRPQMVKLRPKKDETTEAETKKDEVVETTNGDAEAKVETTNGEAEANNGEAEAKNGDAENGHSNGNGVAKNGDHENGNGKEHTNGDSENGHSKTEATTTEETMETSEEDKTESAPKRKADEIEPIPVSAEKIAKLKENEAEEKTETEATPAAEETA